MMIDPVKADVGRRVVYRHQDKECRMIGRLLSGDGSVLMVDFGDGFPREIDRQDLIWDRREETTVSHRTGEQLRPFWLWCLLAVLFGLMAMIVVLATRSG